MTEIFEDDIYREVIMDHYQHPHNKKKLSNPSHFLHDENPLCGDQVTIYLKVKNDKISEASFEGSGCAICVSSSSLLTDNLVGKSVGEVMKMDQNHLLSTMGINPEKIAPARVKCALLPLRTAQKALAVSKNKK